MNVELKDLIKELNDKYQFVKNNRYWNYSKVYNLSINGKNYNITENDILLKIAYNIRNNISKSNDSITNKSMNDFLIPNLDIDIMKNIVKNFFKTINPEFSSRVDFILNKTQFIKYDDNKSSVYQRSVSKDSGIIFYYKNNLQSLVTLAHEVSHGIANLDINCKTSNSNKVGALSEVESELTEELFIEYLKDINLLIKESDDIRTITDDDIEDIKYAIYKSSVIDICYRAIDELEFKKMVNEKKVTDIDDKLIDDLSKSNNMGKNEVIDMLDRFITKYYPDDSIRSNYVGVNDYDLKDGRHLSNECRFIYAFCLVEKFNSMNLDTRQKYEFYKKYLENVKSMTFQEVLELFAVDLSKTDSFSENFIIKYNELVSKDKTLIRLV